MENIKSFYDFLYQMEDDRDYMIANNNYADLTDEGKKYYDSMMEWFNIKIPEYQTIISNILANDN